MPTNLASLPSGLPWLPQDTRLLELELAPAGGKPAPALAAHRVRGWEAINEGFRYELEVLSADAFLALKELEARPARFTIRTAGGGKRAVAGVVTEVASEGSDGALAAYRLTVEPVTAALKLAKGSRVFLGRSCFQAAQDLLQEQLRTNPVFASTLKVDDRCRGRFPAREFLHMHDESPWDFMRRCWAREGVSFVFAPAEEEDGESPRHVLVLFDDGLDLDRNEAGRVRFHRGDGPEEGDGITEWGGVRALQCGKVTRRGWDQADGRSAEATEAVRSDQGETGNALAGTLETYRHETPLEHEAAERFEWETRLWAEAREQRTKAFRGEGTVREFRAGSRFELAEHPVHDQDAPGSREFVLTRVELEAESNLPKGDEASEGSCRNRFTCLRTGIPIRPEEVPFPPVGYLTATVVGPGEETVHTDALGRIRIRLHGARAADHPEAGASGTDKDSFWVRVVQPWSSRGTGGNLIPRVGDEVLVGALNQDPDKLVVVGVLPGGTRKPGRFSGASELPGDKALSGLRSEEHGGSQGSELVFDDTPGEVRARLASDPGASELNLGFLVHPRRDGKARARGEGAELRTDGSAALRAAKGLLLTAAAQVRAEGPQLAREELVQLCEAFRSLTESLGAYAGEHRGLHPDTAPEKALQTRLEGWETGTNTQPGTTRPPEGQRLVALSAPDGLMAATAETAVVYAGKNLDLAAQEEGRVTTGQRLVANAGKGVSLFAHSGGLKAIAHRDALELEAQHGDASMTASENVRIQAAGNEVLISAEKRLTLLCGGSYLTLGPEGVITGGPAFTGKVGSVSWPGIDTRSTGLPPIAMGPTRRRFQHLSKATGDPLPDTPYAILRKGGEVLARGRTNDQGLTQDVELDDLERLDVQFEAEEDPHE